MGGAKGATAGAIEADNFIVRSNASSAAGVGAGGAGATGGATTGGVIEAIGGFNGVGGLREGILTVSDAESTP